MKTLDELLEDAGSALRDEAASRRTPPVSAIHRRHRVRQRSRRAAAAVVIVLIASGLGALLIDRGTDDVQTATTPSVDDQAEAPTEDLSADAAGPGSEPDRIRTLLPGPIGRGDVRYLRTWTHNVTPERSTVMLHEQWFHPDGTAHASVALLSDPGTGSIAVESDLSLWADLDQVPASGDVLREHAAGRHYGFPEEVLAADAERLAEALASPHEPSVVPGVFMSMMSAGGADGSYLPAAATTVREVVRLLPTTMEPAHRHAMRTVLLQLEGAVVTHTEADMLGRDSDLVTVPLEVTDPESGSQIGLLHAAFWLDPETAAPHQIQWLLVDGVLPDDVDTFLDRTVILAAGEVAAFPNETEPDDPAPGTPTTISPSDIDLIFIGTLECLGLPDPDGPPEEFDEGANGLRLTDFYLDPFNGAPTLVIEADPAAVELDAAGRLASTCSDRHGSNIELGYGGDPGGNLDQPIFSGNGWQLTVGEGANPPTDTYKVCHTFASTGESATPANGLNIAGCSDWPDVERVEEYILDAIATALPDGSAVVLFVDLGSLPVEQISATTDDGHVAESAPFVMPHSLKQFVALELPADTRTITVTAILGGERLDQADVQVN